MPDATDDELAARVRRGDHGAFEILLHRHLPSLHRYLCRLTGSTDDADDLAQETFLRLWQRAGSYRPDKARLTTWLHRIAHNMAVDAMRRRRPEPAIQAASADAAPSSRAGTQAESQTADGSEPDALAEEDEFRRRLDTALAALPANQRSALLLCQLQGLSNREAAAVLGISTRALESLLARGRRSLRGVLLDQAPDAGDAASSGDVGTEASAP